MLKGEHTTPSRQNRRDDPTSSPLDHAAPPVTQGQGPPSTPGAAATPAAGVRGRVAQYTGNALVLRIIRIKINSV